MRTKPAGQDRDAFTLNQVGVIFAEVAKDRHANPQRFWATVTTAFLGCRINELAQADLRNDFKQDAASGWWYLNITETAENGSHKKSVKTLAGWRTVPIHPVLIEHGFKQFVDAEIKAGASTLFERYWSPHKPKHGDVLDYAHGIVKWGGNFRKHLIEKKLLADGTHTFFHSMRHTFISHLAKRDVAEEKRSAIVGQAAGGVNAVVYSKLAHNVDWKIEIFSKHLEEYVTLLNTSLK